MPERYEVVFVRFPDYDEISWAVRDSKTNRIAAWSDDDYDYRMTKEACDQLNSRQSFPHDFFWEGLGRAYYLEDRDVPDDYR